jgi:hypothetical protein
MNFVGDPYRRSDRPFDQPVHKRLAASAAEIVVLVEAREQVVRLVDDDDRLSRHSADRVGDQQRRDPLAPVGLGVLFVDLSAKLDREAEARGERLGELALAGSRRAVEEQVRAPTRRASGTAGGRDDPGGEIAPLGQRPRNAPAR